MTKNFIRTAAAFSLAILLSPLAAAPAHAQDSYPYRTLLPVDQDVQYIDLHLRPFDDPKYCPKGTYPLFDYVSNQVFVIPKNTVFVPTDITYRVGVSSSYPPGNLRFAVNGSVPVGWQMAFYSQEIDPDPSNGLQHTTMGQIAVNTGKEFRDSALCMTVAYDNKGGAHMTTEGYDKSVSLRGKLITNKRTIGID